MIPNTNVRIRIAKLVLVKKCFITQTLNYRSCLTVELTRQRESKLLRRTKQVARGATAARVQRFCYVRLSDPARMNRLLVE